MVIRFKLLVSVLALCSALSAWGVPGGPEKGQFYLGPRLAWYDVPAELGYDGSAVGRGAMLGFAFADNWAMEIMYMTFDGEIGFPGNGKGAIENGWANIVYSMPLEGRFTPFVTAGGGRGNYDRHPLDNESNQNEYNAGIGFYTRLTKRFSMRADARALWLYTDEDVRPFASVGLVYKLGKGAPEIPPDADGDGVPDSQDKCPNTPAGRTVGPDGCEVDTDKDGVVDGVDACPNTPAGVKVDSRGCPLDSDSDGVPDYLDKCPDTPRGAKVDASGCPIAITAPVSFDLTVEFAFNSAEINDLSFRELRKAMQFLRDYPMTTAVIEGNTDSVGTDEYNQKLSERRAAAVVDVLVKSGIEANRLSSVGNGESKPVATNDTDEGRQKNRRVSIVVSGANPAQ